MKKLLHIPFATLTVSALLIPPLWADHDEIPFDEANLFFELNNTDGDLGIHAEIDGEPWKRLRIRNRNEKVLLDVIALRQLRSQGMTELNFESAEPTFDELSPEDFFKRFPEGEYEIEGRTLELEVLESEVDLSHVMPAPPSGIDISGVTSVWDDGCPEDEDDLPEVESPVVISWEAVTTSHPDLGKMGDVSIEQYELVLETETEDEQEIIFSVELPPNVTEMEIPEGFIELGEEFKFEILVRDENKNRTAMESCFVVDNDD